MNSLVKDIITPLIAAVAGKPDFSALVLHVHGGIITYGNFLNAAIAFLLIAGAVYFLLVLPMQYVLAKVNKTEPAAPRPRPAPSASPRFRLRRSAASSARSLPS